MHLSRQSQEVRYELTGENAGRRKHDDGISYSGVLVKENDPADYRVILFFLDCGKTEESWIKTMDDGLGCRASFPKEAWIKKVDGKPHECNLYQGTYQAR